MAKHRPHRYCKTDKNQTAIKNELEALGYDVDDVSSIGQGLYDLVVCAGHRCVRVEVKSPGGVLNETEWDYYDAQKNRGTYLVAYSAAEVVEWFKDNNGGCDGLKACPCIAILTP